MKVVTSGADSEYVLGDLVQYLRSNHVEVVDFDFGKVDGCIKKKLSELSHQSTIYITSAHTTLSRRVAKLIIPRFCANYTNYLAPVEVMALLRPRISIFTPHDLLSPYGDSNVNEFSNLDLYDYVLAPFSADELQQQVGSATKCIEAGWIKYHKLLPEAFMSLRGEPLKIVLFVTMIQHLLMKYGDQGMVDYLRPVLKKNVYVKMPAWKGIEPVERLIREQTEATLVDADTSSIRLIQAADLVISSTISSILAESIYFGKPSICLLDDEGESAAVKQAKMAHLQGLTWFPYFDRQELPEDFLLETAQRKVTGRLQPFDFDIVLSIIEKHS